MSYTPEPAFGGSGIFGVRLPTFSGRKRLQLVDGVTALVGPNGSGKSIALSGIRTALTHEEPDDPRMKLLSTVEPRVFLDLGNEAMFEAVKTAESLFGEAAEARVGDYDAWHSTLEGTLEGWRSRLSSKIDDENAVFEGIDSPLVYFSLHDIEELPLQKVSNDLLTEEAFRTIPRNIEWESLADGELSFESFVHRPLRTLRYNSVFPIVGFGVPTQMPTLQLELKTLRSAHEQLKEMAEVNAFFSVMSNDFYVPLMAGKVLSFDTSPLEEHEELEYVIDAARSYETLMELVVDFDICVLAARGGGFRVGELPEFVDTEVPEWVPLVGFELESDPHMWFQGEGEIFEAANEEIALLLERLQNVDVYESEFSPQWDKLFQEVQYILGIEARWNVHDDSIDAGSFEFEWNGSAENIAEWVNEIFEHLLPDAEGLVCTTSFADFTVDGWSLERLLPNLTEEEPSVPISASSDTTQRWAALALRLAIWNFKRWHDFEDLGYAPVVLIDEPERGLGSQAQEHLARGLRTLHDEYGFNFILATHSAAMIGEPDTRIVGLPDFVEIPQPSKLELEELGFSVSELFAFYRSIILVEGHHEEIILNKLIGPEMAEKRARVLPYRGARHLSSAALDDLFDFSGSKFVVTADNTRAEVFNQALTELRSPNLETDTGTQLDELFADLTQEEHAIKSLLMKAHRSQKLDRIGSIVGLDAADILDCLPVETFTEAGTWEELRAAHQHDKSAGVKDTPNDFKKWLELKHNVDFSDENILSGVEQLDELPDFIAQLLDAVS